MNGRNENPNRKAAELRLTYGVGGERVVLQVLIPLVELLLHSVHERLLWCQTLQAGTTFAAYGASVQKNVQHLQSHTVRRPRVAMVSNWLTGTSSGINGRASVRCNR